MQNVNTWTGARVHRRNRRRRQGGGVWTGRRQELGERKINQNLPDTKDPLTQLRPLLPDSMDGSSGAAFSAGPQVFIHHLCVSLIVSHLQL